MLLQILSYNSMVHKQAEIELTLKTCSSCAVTTITVYTTLSNLQLQEFQDLSQPFSKVPPRPNKGSSSELILQHYGAILGRS